MRAWEILVEAKAHISPSGVKTTMDPSDDDYEINYGKKGLVAKFRKDQGMDVETGSKKVTEAKVGRELQHAEDLVIVEGSSGGLRALKAIESLPRDLKNLRIKWDGSPAIYFGRDEVGEFFLTDKSGYLAKGYDGKAKSPEALKSMLGARGKEVDEKRQQFIGEMGNLFPKIEKIVDKKFRGVIFADVLFYTTPPKNDQGEFEFTPNVVTYSIPEDSELGKEIAASDAGLVMHKYNDAPVTGDVPGIDKNGGVFVIHHIPITKPPKIDVSVINAAKGILNLNRVAIDGLLDDGKLAAMKLTDFRATLYKFVNSQVDTGNLSNLNQKFDQWLAGSGVSGPKQAKIKELRQQQPKAFEAIFSSWEAIMKAKDSVIADIDQNSPVKQSVNGKPGGEGYIIGDIKLVPRLHFTMANRAKIR